MKNTAARKTILTLSFCLLLTLAASASTYWHYQGYDISPNQLMLSNWTITGPAGGPNPRLDHPLGKRVHATFTLTNVSDQPILLTEMYVACHYTGKAQKAQAEQKEDFGFLRSIQLNPGESKTLTASLPLNKTGNWRLWPAYKIGKTKSHIRWHDVVLRVSRRALGLLGGVQYYKGPEIVKKDGLEVTNFRLHTVKNPKVGAYAIVDFDITNTTKYNISLSPNGLFVSARDNYPTVIKNFGYKSVNLSPGQTVHVHAARVMDGKGLWMFWAGYQIKKGKNTYFGKTVVTTGDISPFKWHDLDVIVHSH